MTTRGYQLVDPEVIPLLISAGQHAGLLVAVLSWAIEKLTQSNPMWNSVCTIEVISVNYHGAYPGIGIRYFRDDPEDLGDILEVELNRIISEGTVKEFAEFAGRPAKSWSEVWKEMET